MVAVQKVEPRVPPTRVDATVNLGRYPQGRELGMGD
jgi:hypothetical protein